MADSFRQQLLGYLLEALEDSERESVEEQLETDPVLRRELRRLDRTLEPLRDTSPDFTPPDGLAERTCRMVASHCPPDVAAAVDRAATSLPGRVQMESDSATAASGGLSRFSWKDLAVAAGVLAAAALLVFPAIQNRRADARLTACQNNLRELGLALEQYSERNLGYFPPVPQRGKFAAAGIYAPTLLSGGYIDGPQRVLCPGSPLAKDPRFRVPSLDELRNVSAPSKLEKLRRQMGGSYGYSLGFVENGRYHATKNLHRPFFVLMSDAPGDGSPSFKSLNHGGRGQNVVFEDGHVQFLVLPELAGQTGNFFLNDNGIPAAGLHRNDSVIAPSGAGPSAVQ